MAPQWKSLPDFKSQVLKDLMELRFPAVAPTHLYSSSDWKKGDDSNYVGMIKFKETFRFPLHPVDDAGTKGLFLIVDDHWPHFAEFWFDLLEDTNYSFFKKVAMIRVPEDGKLVVTLITVDQSHNYVELACDLHGRVLR